ncbi:MAG: T9SS type A sorting domain-containing protein, partial [Bacteroidales bacterium]|nr:T9SS type A sorting domain-containing protein [Bacteroidales bacterium]
NDTTFPSLRSWNGAFSGHYLSYIGENTFNNTVSFVYNGGCVPEATNFSATGVSGHTIQLSWTTFGGQSVMIVVNDTNDFSTPQNKTYRIGDTLPTGERVFAYNIFNEHTLCTNLQPQTTYYFRLYTMLDDSTYTQGLSSSATTLCPNSGFPYNENFQFVGTTDCWTYNNNGNVSWQKEQDGYNVYLSLKADSGMTVTSGSAEVLITPLNLEGNTNLVMLIDVRNPIYYDTLADSTVVPRIDTLIVKYRNASLYEWQTLRVFCNNISAWQRFSIPLPNIANDYLIALEGRYGGQTLSLDNIKVVSVHLVSVTTDGHGTLSPGSEQNSVAVPDGESVSFSITPDQGYQLNEIFVDYQLQRTANPFVLNNVTAPHVLYVTFSEILSVGDVHNNGQQLVIYPNPSSDKVYVSFGNTAAEYFLYDMSGREITKGTIKPNVPAEIDLGTLPAGVYYIRVNGGDFRTTEKIVLTK